VLIEHSVQSEYDSGPCKESTQKRKCSSTPLDKMAEDGTNNLTYRLRVTMIRPERSIPDEFRPSIGKK